jgi:type II secretory pathway pseudopilin PulG
MRVTRIWDQSGEARRKRHWALRRKRGTTLIEMVLYLGIAAAVMTFSFGLLREEQVRRERTALAAELAQITTAAQTCVAANYANIRDQLVNDTPANGELIKACSIKSLVDQGYLPSLPAVDLRPVRNGTQGLCRQPAMSTACNTASPCMQFCAAAQGRFRRHNRGPIP